ncbi:hypothetical protein C4J89_1893 [Pseudomonas sp. R4-35-07]|nr:hypothetical protein C4J89_1893 [Pseudomonas sp. R4-35-07]
MENKKEVSYDKVGSVFYKIRNSFNKQIINNKKILTSTLPNRTIH